MIIVISKFFDVRKHTRIHLNKFQTLYFVGNCDFETDTCNYVDASVGKFDWGRASPALSPPVDPTGNGRGPSIDNTKKTNQGRYNSLSAHSGLLLSRPTVYHIVNRR